MPPVAASARPPASLQAGAQCEPAPPAAWPVPAPSNRRAGASAASRPSSPRPACANRRCASACRPRRASAPDYWPSATRKPARPKSSAKPPVLLRSKGKRRGKWSRRSPPGSEQPRRSRQLRSQLSLTLVSRQSHVGQKCALFRRQIRRQGAHPLRTHLAAGRMGQQTVYFSHFGRTRLIAEQPCHLSPGAGQASAAASGPIFSCFMGSGTELPSRDNRP